MLILTQAMGFGGKTSGAQSSLSFSLLGSASGTDTSIEINSLSIAAGDLALIFNTADTVGDSTPSGFTQLRTKNISGTIRGCISAKKLNGTETSVTGLSGATVQYWILLVLRPSAAFTSFVDNDTANNTSTTGNPTPHTIAASGETAPVVLYGHMGSSGGVAISPRKTSPTMNELTSNTTHYAHYMIYNPGDTPADHTYDMDDESNQVMQSGYLTFT